MDFTNAIKQSSSLKNEILELEKKIAQAKDQLVQVEKAEYDAALNDFLNRFDLHTVPALYRMSDIIEQAQRAGGHKAEERKDPPKPPVQEKPVRQAPPVKEADPVAEPAKPQPPKAPEAKEEPEDAPDDWDIFKDDENFEEEKPAEEPKQKPPVEEPAKQEEQNSDEEEDDLFRDDWGLFDDDEDEPNEEPKNEIKKEEDKEDPFVIPEAEAPAQESPLLDVDEIISLEADDPVVATYKTKETAVKAEIKLLEAFNKAIEEEWAFKGNLSSLFLDPGDVKANNPVKKKMVEGGVIADKLPGLFEARGSEGSQNAFEDFQRFPYQVRCKAIAMARDDLDKYLA